MVTYRILVRELREIIGGTQIPAYIPMSFTADQNNIFLGELQNFRNLKFGKRLNNYGSLSFEIPANDPKASSLVGLRKYGVWVYRVEDDVSTLVWSGEQAMREGNLDNEGNNWVRIYCYDWLELLNHRFTGVLKEFDGIDAGQIAWTLIEETQADSYGDLFITEGEIEATMDRDRKYYNQNIMEAIINLSDVLSGFDFEITDDMVFNVKTLIGEDKSDSILLEYGFNINRARIIEDFIQPANRAIVLGEAVDEDDIQRVERNDTDLQAINKLRESVISEMDVSDVYSLQEKGDSLLRKYGTALLKLDIDLLKSSTPNITDFSLGDVIKIKIENGVYDIDEEYRIYEWEVEYDDNNVEKLSLVLGKFSL